MDFNNVYLSREWSSSSLFLFLLLRLEDDDLEDEPELELELETDPLKSLPQKILNYNKIDYILEL